MDLLEYQAKTLFREMNIPVLPSQRIDQAQDLKGLKIPYPVVLKSQVHAGGRSQAGGIRFVENTIDAVAAAQAIFNLPIRDEYPHVLLAEAKYNTDQELYLALTLDPLSRRPVLLGSIQGGVGVEQSLSQLQSVVVDQEFSAFYARNLTLKMGLQGRLILAVSSILEKMYRLFVEKDLDLIEINPLGISRTGEVMALDGKVIANNNALRRHPDLVALLQNHYTPVKVPAADIAPFPLNSQPHQCLGSKLNLVELEGNIGILCNGTDLTMATLDLVIQAQGKPANFLNLGGEEHLELTEQLRERLYQALELVSQSPKIKVVLINLITHRLASEGFILEIAHYLKRKSWIGCLPQFILRFTHSPEIAQDYLTQLPVQILTSLDEAVKQAVSFSKK